MIQSSKVARGATASIAGFALAAAGFAAPAAFAAVNTDGAIIQPSGADGVTQVSIIGYNDFHGRINSIDTFAGAVLATRDAFGAANTVIVGSGDQVGASEFESAIQQDQPTIDALLEFGTNQSFTAGNHEFDAGYPDANNRISTALSPAGGLLAANVTLKSDGTHPFAPYRMVTINGLDVAIIGAVTAETAALVSPTGISEIEFGDPVAAVNKIAGELSDGDAANGEADLILASYHEGGPTSGTIDENTANETFANIVNTTSADVDAIYNAHTHQRYAYDAPVPGVAGKTRPVLQAASYGEYISQLVIDVDAAGNVVNTTSVLIETATVDASSLSAESQPAYDNILAIQADALEQAETLGAEEIGVVNTDISRGAGTWADGAATAYDNRAEESALGTVIADSMNVWANNNTTIGSDLSIMNPGGMRAAIAGDGSLTYKDAQTVLPFVNNLSVVELTGADLKATLENQWQRTADGEVPSRSYLQLGLSSNVNYTYDVTQPEGNRITSITIDGVPLDFAKVYKVTMPSFLASGGDNFHAITNAVAVHDTGWVDLDAFKSYIASLPNRELIPEERRNGFEVEGYFTSAPTADAFGTAPVVAQDGSLTFTVKHVDLFSAGFIANETVVATIGDVEVGTGTLSGVTANGEINSTELTITIPASIAAGDHVLTLTAQPAGAAVQLPITVTATETIAPTIAVEHDIYTLEESKSGVQYAGAGWTANEAVELSLTNADGSVSPLGSRDADENGMFSGVLTWAEFDENGNVITDNLEFPAGTYTITATQGDKTASVTFTIGEVAPTPTDDDTATETIAPTTDAPATDVPANDSNDGSNLAQTGADSGLLVGGLALALLFAAGGIALKLRRGDA